MHPSAPKLVIQVLGMLLLVTLWGCKTSAGNPCKQTADCRAGLVCFGSTCLTQQAGDLRCRQDQHADGCRSLGLCTASADGKCIAGKHEDCLKSGICDKLGFCAAVAERCTISASQDADCRKKHGSLQHDQCAFAGLCTAKGGECVAATDEDCKQSVVCKADGSCAATQGRCTLGATTRADCNRQHALRNPCKEDGRCTPKDGGCIATKDTDCTPLEACRRLGQCTAQEERCTAAKDADCRNSEACKDLDLCTRHAEGTCAAADCRKTRACRQLGQCALIDGRCRAGKDADCQQSEGCTQHRYCDADESSGQCLRSKQEGSGGDPRDDAIILVISTSAMLVGDEGEPVLKMPSRAEQIRSGIATQSEGGKPGSLLIEPLSQRLQRIVELERKRRLASWRTAGDSTGEAVVIADEATPYRVLLEVLYTLGQSGIGRYHLMAMKGTEEQAAEKKEPAPLDLPSATPPFEALRSPRALALTVLIGEAGIAIKTRAGAIASGCRELGPSVTIPKQQTHHDFNALATCLGRIKREFPKETGVVISAAYDTPYWLVLQVMDELRGLRGQTLFPNAQFGFAR